MTAIRLFCLLALTALAGCEGVLPPSKKDACTASQLRILEAAEKGDLETVKHYLENSGDPTMHCIGKYSSGGHFGSGYVPMHLYSSIIVSRSEEMLKYYLSYDLPTAIKDDMLSRYAGDTTYVEIARLLVEKDARITACADRCIGVGIRGQTMRNLSEYGYDFNWRDPRDGNTLLMKYALCPANGEEEDIIAMLQLLIELGAKPDIRNKAGKQAKDIAVNPKVRAFLKNIRQSADRRSTLKSHSALLSYAVPHIRGALPSRTTDAIP